MAESEGAIGPDSSLYQGTLDCVHCGLCLSVCPTYKLTGRENSSPRGRLYLMRGVAEGDVPLDSLVAEELDLCLGCRACETACPSGVQYGAILEEGRAAIAAVGARNTVAQRMEKWALRSLIPKRKRLRVFFSLAAVAQHFEGLFSWLLPTRLSRALRLLPPVPRAHERTRLPELTPAKGARRGRVAFLEGCVMAEIFPEVNRATVRVLSDNGFEVVVPRGQTCCGALHSHSGDLAGARELAERNISAFLSAEGETFDAIISNSAGCGASLREFGHLAGEDGARLGTLFRDICEFLFEVGLREELGTIRTRVCYDDPCHLIHGQGIADAPRRLLDQVPGLEWVETLDPGSCCGAAGTYNLLQPKMSQQVLEAKMDSLEVVKPDVIATGNPGCLMQIQAGARERGLAAEVVHPITLIERAQAAHYEAQR